MIKLIPLLLAFQLYAVSPTCANQEKIRSLAIVGHETTFMMKMLTLAQEKFDDVYFVPMREYVQKNTRFPTTPKGVHVFRGNDRFDQLISQKPEAILTFQFVYGNQLANSSWHPRLIVLGSKTSVDQFNALPTSTLEAFKSTEVISFWHSKLKSPDSFHGVGRSITRVLARMGLENDQSILLIGYGESGKGIAFYLKQNGYDVSIYDKNPTEMALALQNGFDVGCLKSLAQNADVVIDATGSQSPIITEETAAYFKQKEVHLLSTSTSDKGFALQNGYQNANGTIFVVDPSLGMINMYYKIGGSDDTAMRLTGFSLLYIAENFPTICNKVVPLSPFLFAPSAQLDAEIAEAFLQAPNLLGNSRATVKGFVPGCSN